MESYYNIHVVQYPPWKVDKVHWSFNLWPWSNLTHIQTWPDSSRVVPLVWIWRSYLKTMESYFVYNIVQCGSWKVHWHFDICHIWPIFEFDMSLQKMYHCGYSATLVWIWGSKLHVWKRIVYCTTSLLTTPPPKIKMPTFASAAQMRPKTQTFAVIAEKICYYFNFPHILIGLCWISILNTLRNISIVMVLKLYSNCHSIIACFT